MAIPALLDAACPAAKPICLNPPAAARGLCDLEVAPSVTTFGMLKHAAEYTNGVERCSEAAAIIT